MKIPRAFDWRREWPVGTVLHWPGYGACQVTEHGQYGPTALILDDPRDHLPAGARWHQPPHDFDRITVTSRPEPTP